MKTITVLSGKGGTGKTSMVGSFAALAKKDLVLVDGDVDAANLKLIVGSEVIEEHDFYASRTAVIDPNRCRSCELCRDLCRFDAIAENYVVNPISCEGCSLCAHACPHDAIIMEEVLSGKWFVSQTPYGLMVHARLGIAEENSGKLVTLIRNRAREAALSKKCNYLMIDGPPGIGCPVIASLSGVDLVLLVTEPTVSGIHDLERVLAVCRHFKVPAAVCINRFDLDEEQTDSIEKYCNKEQIKVVGKIPYDQVFMEAIVNGVPVVEYSGGSTSSKVVETWVNFASLLN